MNFVDYYSILGINQSATPTEIKNAYRKLARKFHPDLNPKNADAKKNFQQINEANAVLSDPEKRKKYDQYGKDWQQAEAFEKQKQQQERTANAYSQHQTNDDFSSFFESMFGGASANNRASQTKYRGEDFNAELHLNLIDVYKTHKQELKVNGQNIRITIPAGIENGQTIKIAGYGGKGVKGGPNGDLYIAFSIANHPLFKRLGNNLYATVEIDLYTALLGGEITVETLNGKVKLKVAPETQTGTKVKLKEKGFPVYKNEGQYGDLYITYTVIIPTNLNDKQKALFTELSKS